MKTMLLKQKLDSFIHFIRSGHFYIAPLLEVRDVPGSIFLPGTEY